MPATPGNIRDTVDFLTVFLFILSIETLEIYGQEGDGCGHTALGAQSGTLASRNYPGTYPNGTWCEWRLWVPRGRTLRLVFGDFDLEESPGCSAGSLTVTQSGEAPRLGPVCGHRSATQRWLALNSSEAVVRFSSGIHRSGRGFLLSYATDQQSDLISCMERGTHYTSEQFRAFCPAGCKGVTGDIWGRSGQGYRDTSVLCKAAVHAGAVSDDLGGTIAVSRERSITLYESSFANGLLSKTGSLSEKKLVFLHECDSPLNVFGLNASSIWEEVDGLDPHIIWSPGKKNSAERALPWVANSEDPKPWLELDLQRKNNITGIITKGYSAGSSDFYVQSYILHYSKDRRNWKSYKAALSREEKVFEGNLDSHQEVLNSLIPPVVARYFRLLPKTWRGQAAAHVRVLGCQSAPLRPRMASPPQNSPPAVTPHEDPLSEGPEIKKDAGNSTSRPMLMAVGIVLVLALCLGFLLVGIRWKRRRNAANMKCSLAKGSQSVLGKKLPRCESELISYPVERSIHDALPAPPLNDYAEPDLIVTGQKLGSTFRPVVDEGYTVPLMVNHYDVPGKVPEYAEPLPPEPEYAMPFGEQGPDSSQGAKRNLCVVRVAPPTQAVGVCTNSSSPLPSQYDCPAQRGAPNVYFSPHSHGNGSCTLSVVYTEPQPPNPLFQHTYHEPL